MSATLDPDRLLTEVDARLAALADRVARLVEDDDEDRTPVAAPQQAAHDTPRTLED